MTLDRPEFFRALETPLDALRSGALSPVTVAVVDSGIDGSHPDIAGRLEAAYAVEPGSDGAVRITEMPVDANNDAFGHGTAVASILSRVAPNVRLIDVRVLGRNNSSTGEALIAGLAHAIDGGAPVINMSLAVAQKFVQRLAPLCERAYHRSQIVVAARRNLPLHDEGYPAALISCLGVDNGGEGKEFSWRYRSHVIEYEAHGANLTAAAPGGGYTTVTGTSFATPIVSGLVAVLKGAFPQLRPFEVKAILKALATDGGREAGS